ncbi:MAG: PAS domain S-box protein [Methanobacteriaceae archaeon]|jgi:PAS domain S-box-containing protein|nr:PAS domain S-box protein [Methanobacteriaceae archaeon]
MGEEYNQVGKELHQSSEILLSIYNLNPDAIIFTRVSDGKFLDCNPEFLNKTGYSREEVIGHTSMDLNLFSPEILQTYIDAIKKEGKLFNFEMRVRKKDGTFLDILNSARFIDVDGEEFILSISRNITQLKKKEEENQNLIEELDVANEELRSSNEELQSANETLRENSELYRQFFNSPLNGFALCELLVDDEGKPSDFIYLEVNKTFEDFTGLTRDDVLNKKVTEVLPPEEAAELIEKYGRVVLEGEKAHFELPRPSSNKYYEIYAFSPKERQFIALIMDITSHKEAEEKALKAQKDWEDTFYAVPDLIALVDTDYNVLRVNRSLADRLHIKPEDCKGLKCYELIHGTHEPPLICPHTLMMEDNVEHTREMHEDDLDGDFIVSASPIYNEKQELIGDVHVLRDITQRKKAELRIQGMLENEQSLTEELRVSNEELQDITEELQTSNEGLQSTTIELQKANEKLTSYKDSLEEAIEKLEISNRELEQFAYVASHDLQEPLRMVSSFAQLLEKRYKGELDDDADDFIGFIVEGAQRMKDLIDDLLTFSRLSTASREFRPTNMNKVLEDVLLSIKPSVEAENATISHDDLPTVQCDPSQIRQLFQNLISNAIKFHEKAPEIHIFAEESDGKWRFGVSDNGIGIHPDHQDKIFDIFKRLHTREEYEGTGIGLSICKRIVEIHGGDIWVKSKPGEGSTFYFTLPKR